MHFTLFYFSNPHTARIQLHGISLVELPGNVLAFGNSSSEARAFVEYLEWLDGVVSVAISSTTHEISIRKTPKITWTDTMPIILEILRDRFAPGQALTNEFTPRFPRCPDRHLTPDDFQFLPPPTERQLVLSFLD